MEKVADVAVAYTRGVSGASRVVVLHGDDGTPSEARFAVEVDTKRVVLVKGRVEIAAFLLALETALGSSALDAARDSGGLTEVSERLWFPRGSR